MANARHASSSSASAKNCDTDHYRAGSDTGLHPKTSPTMDQIEFARTQYEAFKLSLRDYLPLELPNHRANSRQKLTKLTRAQFRELSMDTYDELVRRNESESPSAPFLPARDDFHPKRNQARQHLSTIRAHRLDDLCSDVFHELGRSSSTRDRIEVARTQYEAFKLSLRDYLPQEPPNHRASSRQKLAKLTRDQFRDLSMDTYDELLRRNESEKPSVPFLPARDDFHPQRNQARQQLSTFRPHRLDDLYSDVFHELGRRYPEITVPDVKKWDELPRALDSPPPPYEPPAPQVVVGDEPARQGYFLVFVNKVGGVFGC